MTSTRLNGRPSRFTPAPCPGSKKGRCRRPRPECAAGGWNLSAAVENRTRPRCRSGRANQQTGELAHALVAPSGCRRLLVAGARIATARADRWGLRCWMAFPAWLLSRRWRQNGSLDLPCGWVLVVLGHLVGCWNSPDSGDRAGGRPPAVLNPRLFTLPTCPE